MLLVRPDSISCLCLNMLVRAPPLPSSSIPCVSTPNNVLLPASTFPTTATRRSTWSPGSHWRWRTRSAVISCVEYNRETHMDCEQSWRAFIAASWLFGSLMPTAGSWYEIWRTDSKIIASRPAFSTVCSRMGPNVTVSSWPRSTCSNCCSSIAVAYATRCLYIAWPQRVGSSQCWLMHIRLLNFTQHRI